MRSRREWLVGQGQQESVPAVEGGVNEEMSVRLAKVAGNEETEKG
jgi:hypothetical protein